MEKPSNINYVVNVKNTKEFDIYVGRPSKYGNPFVIGKDGTREVVIDRFFAWLLSNYYPMCDIHELKDKILACHCAPLPCHAHILETASKLKWNWCSICSHHQTYDKNCDLCNHGSWLKQNNT